MRPASRLPLVFYVGLLLITAIAGSRFWLDFERSTVTISLLLPVVDAASVVVCLGAILALRRQHFNAALFTGSVALSAIVGATFYEVHLREVIVGTRLAPAPAMNEQIAAEELQREIAAADWTPRHEMLAKLAESSGDVNHGGGLFNLLPWADAGYLETLPLSTMARMTTLHCNEGGYWPVFETDRFGFNNRDAVWDEAGRRVLLVGDSFAHGSCVEQSDTIAAQLGDLGFVSASIGIGGNGPLLELAGLSEYGPVFRPDMVIWFYFDWHMLNRLRILEPRSGWGGEAYSHVLTRYLEDGFSQNLVARQGEIDAIWGTLSSALSEFEGRRAADGEFDSHRLAAVTHVRAGHGMRPFADLGDQLDIDETIDLFLKILATAKRRIENWGGKLYLATFYDISRFRGGPETNRDDVLPRVEALGIPVIDIDAAIAATPEPLANFPFHGMPTPFNSAGWAHFNAAGYRVFADAIATAIK